MESCGSGLPRTLEQKKGGLLVCVCVCVNNVAIYLGSGDGIHSHPLVYRHARYAKTMAKKTMT